MTYVHLCKRSSPQQTVQLLGFSCFLAAMGIKIKVRACDSFIFEIIIHKVGHVIAHVEVTVPSPSCFPLHMDLNSASSKSPHFVRSRLPYPLAR